MDLETHRDVGKILFLMPIFGPAALLLTSCGPTQVPPQKKSCEVFPQPADQHYVDGKSFATFNYLFGENLAVAKIENWQPRARVSLGAAKELYQLSCEAGEKVVKGDVQSYFNAAREFFAKHYEKKADENENSILVLIAGMAPVSISENVVSGALDALAAVAVADPKIADEKKNFALVLKAGYFFNKAAEKLDEKARFSTLSVPCKMTDAERAEAKKALEGSEALLKDVNASALNDRQQEFLTGLTQATVQLKAALGKKCGKGGKSGGMDDVTK